MKISDIQYYCDANSLLDQIHQTRDWSVVVFEDGHVFVLDPMRNEHLFDRILDAMEGIINILWGSHGAYMSLAALEYHAFYNYSQQAITILSHLAQHLLYDQSSNSATKAKKGGGHGCV